MYLVNQAAAVESLMGLCNADCWGRSTLLSADFVVGFTAPWSAGVCVVVVGSVRV